MNDATTAGDGPISTQPEGNPDLGLPGDSPPADAPTLDPSTPDAPDLAPDSTAPAAPTGDATPPPAGEDNDDAPPLPGETADTEWIDDEPAADESTAEELTAAPAPASADIRPEPRRLSRGEREMVDRTRQRFAACGRCGYLIADLQLLLGEEALQTAAIGARDGWLRLEGDERLRTLLIDAFGVRLDIGYEAMDGACPECRRRFVFAALDDGRARLKLRT